LFSLGATPVSQAKMSWTEQKAQFKVIVMSDSQVPARLLKCHVEIQNSNHGFRAGTFFAAHQFSPFIEETKIESKRGMTSEVTQEVGDKPRNQVFLNATQQTFRMRVCGSHRSTVRRLSL
jgi:hypothetical protein